MIPKIIHYCWLSKEKQSPFIQGCIRSWRKIMPDYQIICWDVNRFDLNLSPFAKEAYEKRKWAFAADYIRLFALYNYGGVFLDSDVRVFKRFDAFLNHGFVSSIDIQQGLEGHLDFGIQAAIMGAEVHNPFVKDCLSYYENRHFIKEDGSLSIKPIAPDIIAMYADKYGLKRINQFQLLEPNIAIYPASVFAGHPIYWTKQSIAMHFCNNSWIPKSRIHKLTSYLYNNYRLPMLLKKIYFRLRRFYINV